MKSAINRIQQLAGRAAVMVLPAILAISVSCTKQENGGEITPSDNVPAAYLKIGSVTTFPTDQPVSIGVFLEGEGYTSDSYKNIKCIKMAGAGSWSIPLTELLESEATVYAYYPYKEGISDVKQIPVASSVCGDDWMWAEPVGKVSKTNPTVNLKFNHSLALVEITFDIYGFDHTMNNLKMSAIKLYGEGFKFGGSLNAKDGTLTPDSGDAPSETSPLASPTELQLSVSDHSVVADGLLVPVDGSRNERTITISCSFGGKVRKATVPGVIISPNTKSTILLNIKDSDSKMEVVSVGVDGWDDKVSGSTAEVDGHTVTFTCPEGLIYNLHLEQEASGSFDEQTSGTLKSILTFSYDGSAPSVPQAKFLSVEGPASGCEFKIDKAAHTITVTDVTTDVNFNLSLGNITFIPYTATAKVEPTDKKIAGLPLNEEKSTFNGTSGTIAIDGELTAIGDNAFNGNTALTGITLPEGITSIGQSAFDECHNLVLPTLPNSVAYIGKYAFRRAGKSASQTTDLVLPEDLTTIERYAFEECRIKTLTGNAKLQTIWIGAFKKCNDLTAVSFKGETAPTIQDGDIFTDTDLTKTSGIAVPKTSGHATLFSYKKADWWKDIANGIIREEGTTVTLIPYTATAKITLKTKDNPTDYSWGANTEYVIDESASRYDTDTGKGEWFFIGEGSAVPTKIPAEMFSDGFTADKTIQSITIPEGVLSIGKRAFTLCENLTSVSFPTTLTTIEAYGDYKYAIGVFQECYYLTAIDLSGCSNLKDIPIQCFRNCNRVTSLTLPDNLESIGQDAFYNLGSNSEVESLILPASLTSLGPRSFESSKIKTVTLCSNLKSSINTEAFYGGTVTNVIFEDGSNPANTMFWKCGITTITSKSATPPDLCLLSSDKTVETVFHFDDYSKTTVYVPSASVSTYKAANGWKNFGDKIQAIK
ncbi:MAG: leucine-rich repeat protein [Bacteroidales bacterium]|nr:leucine-rich repeat protein [Bacteroidales bacterium]